MIDIKGLNKAEVLKALYDGSYIQGMGFMQAVPEGTVTVEHCKMLLETTGYPYFDYLYGRVLKVDLSKDAFDERLYDRDNGQGTAARIIDRLKRKNSATSINYGMLRLDCVNLDIRILPDFDTPGVFNFQFKDLSSLNVMILNLEELRAKMEGGTRK